MNNLNDKKGFKNPRLVQSYGHVKWGLWVDLAYWLMLLILSM